MSRTRLVLRSSLTLLVAACATLPRPEPLLVAEKQESQPLMQEAAQLAPQMFAHAQRLRERAEQAHNQGDSEAAEILAEHALAAFQRAVVQSRVVKARARIAAAEADLNETEEKLALLGQSQQATEAEAKALELRVQVIRDAEPKAAIEPASPAREAARREAAKSISEAARLLCLATRMLAPDSSSATALFAKLDELDQRLQAAERPTPIDLAMDLRSQCLKALTMARRTGLQAAPEVDTADALFTQVASKLPEHPPIRDDRGIVISVPDLFTKNRAELSATGEKALPKLAELAVANPQFPLLVVVHGPQAVAARQESALRAELQRHGVTQVEIRSAGTRLPAGAGEVRGAPQPAGRVEFVLVAR